MDIVLFIIQVIITGIICYFIDNKFFKEDTTKANFFSLLAYIAVFAVVWLISEIIVYFLF